jgi:hypothetical protein
MISPKKNAYSHPSKIIKSVVGMVTVNAVVANNGGVAG